MSPRIVFCLTLLGVLLAGVPLLHLTGRSAPAEAVPAAASSAAVQERVWLVVRCTGRPEGMSVRHAGKCLAEGALEDGVWEGEVSLPVAGRWELEVSVRWPEERAGEAQAVGVALTPPGRAEMVDTQWTFPGEAELLSVFTFTNAKP